MNILVRTADGETTFRPDTTLNKDCTDWYCPDEADTVWGLPVVFAHTPQAGKMIDRRFVRRYLGESGAGLFLFATKGGEDLSRMTSSVYDRTSYLPLHTEGKIQEGDVLSIIRDDESIFSIPLAGHRKTLEETLVCCTTHCSVRRGDVISYEAAPPAILCSRDKGNARIKASLGKEVIIDIEIIF